MEMGVQIVMEQNEDAIDTPPRGPQPGNPTSLNNPWARTPTPSRVGWIYGDAHVFLEPTTPKAPPPTPVNIVESGGSKRTPSPAHQQVHSATACSPPSKASSKSSKWQTPDSKRSRSTNSGGDWLEELTPSTKIMHESKRSRTSAGEHWDTAVMPLTLPSVKGELNPSVVKAQHFALGCLASSTTKVNVQSTMRIPSATSSAVTTSTSVAVDSVSTSSSSTAGMASGESNTSVKVQTKLTVRKGMMGKGSCLALNCDNDDKPLK